MGHFRALVYASTALLPFASSALVAVLPSLSPGTVMSLNSRAFLRCAALTFQCGTAGRGPPLDVVRPDSTLESSVRFRDSLCDAESVWSHHCREVHQEPAGANVFGSRERPRPSLLRRNLRRVGVSPAPHGTCDGSRKGPKQVCPRKSSHRQPGFLVALR